MLSSRNNSYLLFSLMLLIGARVACGIWLLMLADLPFLPLSFDSFARTLFAYRWQEWVGVWLPLPILLNGLLMRLLPEAWWLYTPTFINLIAGNMALLILYGFSRDLWEEESAALMTLLTVLFLPWGVWLSVSGLAGSLFMVGVMLGLWGWIRWLKTDYLSDLALCVGGMLIAEMTRYEAWSLSGLMFLSIAYHLWHSRPKRLMTYLLPLPLLTFPAMWMAAHGAKHGDPFYFSNFVKAQVRDNFTLFESATVYLRELVQLEPLLLLLCLVGIGWWLITARPFKTLAMEYLLLCLLWIGSLILSSLMGNRPSHLLVRVMITPMFMLTPFAGYALNRMMTSPQRWRQFSAFAMLTLLLINQLSHLTAYPPTVSDSIRQISQQLAVMWQTEQLAPNDLVLFERQGWDFVPIQALSGHPDQIWVDSTPPAGLRVQISPLIISHLTSTEMERAPFRLIITAIPETQHHLSQFLSPIATVGDYQLYAHTEDAANFQHHSE